ncbi:MAG TPA: hypothetical protein VF648_07115 [Pyrinomonadaceae bacterium]|jgi:hypothetical protein
MQLKTGDKVLRKSDRDRGLYIGEVVCVTANHARIKWDAKWRIGGGSLHSEVKLPARNLILATDEAIAERRVDVRFAKVGNWLRITLQDAGEDWLVRNNRTAEQHFEEKQAELREYVIKLIRGGRALLELRGKQCFQNERPDARPPPPSASRDALEASSSSRTVS